MFIFVKNQHGVLIPINLAHVAKVKQAPNSSSSTIRSEIYFNASDRVACDREFSIETIEEVGGKIAAVEGIENPYAKAKMDLAEAVKVAEAAKEEKPNTTTPASDAGDTDLSVD